MRIRGWPVAPIRREQRIKRLFSEYPFRERFDRADEAGFEAVEFPEPYGEALDWS